MIFFEGFQNRPLPVMLRREHLVQPESSGLQCVEVNHDDVSTLYKRQSASAKQLCIHDIASKIKRYGEYDIGGTYTDSEPDLWFYFTTSFCPGNKCLLNLFVCLRKVGCISIGVSDSNDTTHGPVTGNSIGRSSLPARLKWYVFKSSKPDEKHFIKSYCFSAADEVMFEGRILCIPISININPASSFNQDLIKQIKLNHDFGELLSKQEKTNFVVQSASGKQYYTHKIILAAHSPVLKNMVKSNTVSSISLDIKDEDMELLLEFLYTGTIKDIRIQNCLNLLDIAGRFKLNNMLLLVQFAIADQINVSNAVEMAQISEKYKLEKLQNSIFHFIKQNPSVTESEGWQNLDDVHLAKKLFQYLHNNTNNNVVMF